MTRSTTAAESLASIAVKPEFGARGWSVLWPLIVLGIYCLIAARLPLADDELYYWSWSRFLQFSYYDHPPAVAYLIHASTLLFGKTALGVRFPACVCSVFVLLAIHQLMRPRTLFPLLFLTPIFSLGAIIITPDAPLLTCWSGYLLFLVKLHEVLAEPDGPRQRELWKLWWLGGVILGAGVLSKYTMALAVPAGFATFLVCGQSWRKWLPGYLGHGVISAIVASPIAIYNAQHDWKPLLFQLKHSMVGAAPVGWSPFAEFLGVQMLLVGTGPIVLWPWFVKNFRRFLQEPRLRVCFCLYVLPLGFFFYKATQARLEGNWALCSFVAYWPLAAYWFETVRESRSWRIAAYAGFIPPAFAVTFLAVHLIHPLPVIPVEKDRITRQASLIAVADAVANAIKERQENLPVYAPTYQMVARLRWAGIDARQIDGLTRHSQYTQEPQTLEHVRRAYLVDLRPLPENFAAGFPAPKNLRDFPLIVRGVDIDHTTLWLYERRVDSGE